MLLWKLLHTPAVFIIIKYYTNTYGLSYTAAPSPPTDLSARFTSSSTISVSWTPPSGGATPTGYEIYYEATVGAADTGSVSVSGASVSQYTITGRTSDDYAIGIVALSANLPSTVTELTTIRGEF